LDLSTGHLPEQLGSQGLSGHDGVTAYQLPYGWLMWVPTDPQTHVDDHPDPPPEVLAIARHARGLGCDDVLFDADADQVGRPAHLGLVTPAPHTTHVTLPGPRWPRATPGGNLG